MEYYITILDFVNGSVDQFNLTDYYDKKTIANFLTEEIEEFIESKGYNLNSIEWMAHNNSGMNYLLHNISLKFNMDWEKISRNPKNINK